MKVLVIIVTYNGIQWIDRCLGSVRSSLVKADAFVVDNGSTDGTQEYIQQHFPETIFCQSKENLGFGKANNIGLLYALEKEYDYAYLLNQDAWVMPDTLMKMIEEHKRDTTYGILSPIQIEANKKNLDKNFLTNLCYQGKPVINDIIMGNQKVSPIDMVMAAHWLISKECFRTVGAFSPSFPHYGEDNNYSDRTLFHGFKIGIVTNAFAVHDREFRSKTKNQLIYEEYIKAIVNTSSVFFTKKNPVMSSWYHMLHAIIKYKSILPLKYLYRYTKNLPEIVSNRELSKQKSAFL